MKYREFLSCVCILVAFWFAGCDSEGEDYPSVLQQGGEIEALVLNEGLFTTNTGALSLIYKDGSVVTDVFRDVNRRPLGDVAQSITKINGHYFIVLNNSKKIEVVDPVSFRSLGTIRYTRAGLPRYIVPVSPTEAIVSDLDRQLVRIRTQPPYGDAVEFIPVERPVEYMVVAENKLFGMTAGGLYVFDVADISKEKGRVIKAVRNEEVTKSCQLLVDYRGYIWALLHEKQGSTVTGISFACVDPKTERVIATHTLPLQLAGTPVPGDVVGFVNYNRTDMDPEKRWIYFNVKTCTSEAAGWQQSVYRLNVENGTFELYRHLPGTELMYGFAVSPSGDVYLCDCLDYTAQRGYVRKYTADGEVCSYRVGVYPGQVYFPKE